MTQATWTSPLSNRVLLEAGFSRFQYLWAGFGIAPPDSLTSLIPVTESQAIDDHRANFTYRGTFDPLGFGWANNDANPNNWRASMAYVTGAHNLKIGYQGSYQRSLQARDANSTLLRYTMNNRQLNGVSYTLATRWEQNDRTATSALFVQDQWTMGRVTLQGALRYDRASSWAPAEGNGTTEISRFNPAPITFPRTVSVSGYNDITTRLGAAWDVFGNGRTALKANWRQVPAECHQRRELHRQQPRGPNPEERVDAGARVAGQRELHRRLRSEEPGAHRTIWRPAVTTAAR